MNLSEIQKELDEAAQAIATLPVEQWLGWAVYLLESLDTIITEGCDAEYDREVQYQLLRDIKNNIETRLRTGDW